MSEHRHFDFAITARKARKRNPTVATTSQIQALPTHPDGAWNGQRPRKPGGPECNRRNATARNNLEAMEQRNPTRRQEAGAIIRNNAMAMERCNASGHHQIHDNTLARLELTRNKRQWRTALRWHQVTGLRGPTRRKAPAANKPRNNVTSCRHQREQPESKSNPIPQKYGTA